MAETQNSSIFDKLTDTRLYTGAHKHRFDDNGVGLGLAGRDRAAKGAGYIAGAPGGNVQDLSQITRTNLSLMPPPSRGGGCPILYGRAGSNDGKGYPTPLSPTGPRPGSVGRRQLVATCRSNSPVRLSDNGNGNGNGNGNVNAPPSPKPIFDRLTDPSTYTGMHKHRFAPDGRGLGAEGRTLPPAHLSPMENVQRS